MSLALPLFLIGFSAPSAILLLMHLWGAIRPYQLTHPTALLAMLSCLLCLATHDPLSPMLSPLGWDVLATHVLFPSQQCTSNLHAWHSLPV